MNRVYSFILCGLLCGCSDPDLTTQEILIRVDRSELLCDNGGTQLNLGLDVNGNGMLEDNEVYTSDIFCDDSSDDEIGIEWRKSEELITCNGQGGLSISIYYDWDNNVYPIEICDGFDLGNYLIEIDAIIEIGVCGGGHVIKFGTDANNNRLLEDDEIEMSTEIRDRKTFEEKVTIGYTLTEADYIDIAQKYANTNPEAAANLEEFKSFHFSLWSQEEISNIILEKIIEYGTKVGCQTYSISYEYFSGSGIETVTRKYSYNHIFDVYTFAL